MWEHSVNHEGGFTCLFVHLLIYYFLWHYPRQCAGLAARLCLHRHCSYEGLEVIGLAIPEWYIIPQIVSSILIGKLAQ